MKQWCFLFFCIFFCVVPGMTVYAGEVSSVESALVEIGEGKYEYEGSYYVFVEEYKVKLVNYLSRDDIDLKKWEVDGYIAVFYGSLGELVNSKYMCKVEEEKKEDTNVPPPDTGQPEAPQPDSEQPPSTESSGKTSEKSSEKSSENSEELSEEISSETEKNSNENNDIDTSVEEKKAENQQQEESELLDNESLTENVIAKDEQPEKQFRIEWIILFILGIVAVVVIPFGYILRKKKRK